MRTAFFWRRMAAGGLLCGALLGAHAEDQPPVPPVPPTPAGLAQPAPLHHLAPIAYFRGLLAMNPSERARELARKSPEDRALLQAKIEEYEALPRPVREARLCQTELHWELLALLRLPPEGRAARLAEVSPLYQPMVKDLLRQWDTVPPEAQKTLLEKQSFIGLYLRLRDNPVAAQKNIIDKWPEARRVRWAEDMGRWQALPENERAELCAQFERFCLLSGTDRQPTVHALSASERAMMEEALRAFDLLPPAQRLQCINSFGKFATMAPEERAQFLKNAARWDAMTARERALWRQLVHTLPALPPAPPGMLQGLPPMPAAPPENPLLPPMPPNVTAPVVIARAPRA